MSTYQGSASDLDLPQILYVGGLGRSGSTLLERAIAQLPGVVGAGEVVYLWERGIVNNERCGCGQSFHDCPFWGEVGARAFGGWHNVDVDRVHELGRRVDDVKHVPRMLLRLDKGRFRKELEEYLRYYLRLYAAIKEVSGCDIVVDSSKITSLAYVLSHSLPLRLSMVHILRDARAVAYSWTKVVKRPEVTSTEAYMPRFSPGYMALLYDGHHVLLELLRTRGVRSVTVRYEDFASDPIASLTSVAHLLDAPFDPSTVLGEQPRSLRLPAMHTVSGNPSRFTSGDVVVRRDDAWREKMPRRQRTLVGVVTAPVQAFYGYLRPSQAIEAAAPVSLPEPHVWPDVTAVVPTHNRPGLMRQAVASIVAQDYPGVVETTIVYDKAEPEPEMISDDPRRPVRVITNTRAPGLAGARNSGILDSKADLVAFCDDDDRWGPDKLRRQVQALEAERGAVFATTAMRVEYAERSIERLAGRNRIVHADLTRSRMAMLHSSSFLVRRDALVGGIGLVDESLPQSMAEDWDLLLRAAARHPLVHVDEPLVRVRWGRSTYFADRWRVRNEATEWLLTHHPGLRADPIGAGLTMGQIAYGCAMVGDRGAALRWALRSMRANWREPRGYLASTVALRVISGQWLINQLNKRGHGI